MIWLVVPWLPPFLPPSLSHPSVPLFHPPSCHFDIAPSDSPSALPGVPFLALTFFSFFLTTASVLLFLLYRFWLLFVNVYTYQYFFKKPCFFYFLLFFFVVIFVFLFSFLIGCWCCCCCFFFCAVYRKKMLAFFVLPCLLVAAVASGLPPSAVLEWVERKPQDSPTGVDPDEAHEGAGTRRHLLGRFPGEICFGSIPLLWRCFFCTGAGCIVCSKTCRL